MEVTKVSIQLKNSNRVNVFVDGKFYRGLDRIVAMKLGLRRGLTLTPYLVKQLEGTQQQNSAWEYALRSLQRSPKSIKSLKQKLITKFEPIVVDETIEKLVANQIVDDDKLAQNLVAQYIEQGSKSKKQITTKLIQRGIPRDVIQKAAANVTRDHEYSAALKLAQHKVRELKDFPWREKFEKIGAYLARRGFNYDLIRTVVVPENLEIEESA